jgi:hypothetical protein
LSIAAGSAAQAEMPRSAAGAAAVAANAAVRRRKARRPMLEFIKAAPLA